MRLSWSRTLTTPLRPETMILYPSSSGTSMNFTPSYWSFPSNFDGDLRLGSDEACRAARVERAEGQLRPRLADRLRGDDPDGLARLNELAGRQVPAVAERADAPLRFAHQHRADLHGLDRGLGDAVGLLLVDELARPDDHFARHRVHHVVDGDPSHDALGERLLHVLPFLQRARDDAADRPAVFHRDDRILRDVDKAARQVARIGRLEGGIRQTLARAVRGDEVLEDREPFPEIRDDRVLDQLPGRARRGSSAAWPSGRAYRPAGGPAPWSRGRPSRPSCRAS